MTEWNFLQPVIAIELLNCKYFDPEIRNFAVKCLQKYMKDEEIQAYLLQLVQVTKNNPNFF